MTNEPFIPVPIVTDQQGIKLAKAILQDQGFWDRFQKNQLSISEHQGYANAHWFLDFFYEALCDDFIYRLRESNSTMMMPNPNWQP